ncbi:MAG: hypothetical protein ACP5G5_04095 [Thermoplasmata archaeon]
MNITVQNNRISENGNELGSIAYTGIYPNITIRGKINIDVVKKGGEFRISEDGLPVGTFKKMKISYMGRPYELERGGYSRLLSMREGMVNVMSLGMQVGRLGWIRGILTVECERSDLVPILVFASYISFFARKGKRRMPSPYREIYYAILALFFIYILIVNLFPFNYFLDIVVPIIIMSLEYVVIYLSRRK